jgi:hypothetical protein
VERVDEIGDHDQSSYRGKHQTHPTSRHRWHLPSELSARAQAIRAPRARRGSLRRQMRTPVLLYHPNG